jgi:photosystem II stability/assembly factor-like uncharacterized protein
MTSAHDGSIFHRSLNDGVTWEKMSLGNELPEGSMNDFAFTSGKIYGMTCWGLLESVDAGDNWSLITMYPDCMASLELDEKGVPLYGGGGSRGVFLLENGGYEWEIKAEGMDAIEPWGLAASAASPEQVYVAAGAVGGFLSADNGQTWLAVEIPESAGGVGADPNLPCVGYIGGTGYVYRTQDCGKKWYTSTLPGALVYQGVVEDIAVDPNNSDNILAGGLRYDGEKTFGMIYRSTNGGNYWEEIDLGHPLSIVDTIVFDPAISGTVYFATGGESVGQVGSVYKSADSGLTWDEKSNGLTGAGITSLVIHPNNSQILYLSAYDDTNKFGAGIFKSNNGGDLWELLSPGYPNPSITSLVLDPLDPDTLYAGSWRHDGAGLYRSVDGGYHWDRTGFPLGYVDIYCLAAESAEDLTYLYVGTVGGASPEIPGTASLSRMSADIGGGVYQQTIVHLQGEIFLPLVVRD